MLRKLVGVGAAATVATLVLAGCGGTGVDISDGGAMDVAAGGATSDTGGAVDSGGGDEQPVFASGRVCVILPNDDPADRWAAIDKPALEAAFTEAGIESDIQSADDDPATFSQIANDMVTNGCSALIITSIDAATSQEVISNAQLSGVSVIDYDRLSIGGLADYVVMTDPAKVGTALGEGLASCLTAAGTSSGDVALLNAGDTTLSEAFEAAATDAGFTPTTTEIAADATDDLGSAVKGAAGVAAADDTLATSAVDAVGDGVPVAGQGTTADALQRVLLGTQCMTVFSHIDQEATAVAQLAGAVAVGDMEAIATLAPGIVIDPDTTAEQPAALVDPISVTAETVKDLVTEGLVTTDELCTTAELTAACTAAGIS